MNKVLIFLLCLFAFGCGPSVPSVSNQVISKSQISKMIYENLTISYGWISDEEYTLATIDWIDNNFSPAFYSFLNTENLWAYAPESNDCDKFASWARLYAQKLNNQTKSHGKSSLAVGTLFYIPDSAGGAGHAINVFIIYKDNNYSLVFFEPQNQQRISLSAAEKKSIVFWEF